MDKCEKLEKNAELFSWPEGFEEASKMLDFLPDDLELRKSVLQNIIQVMYCN